MNFVDRSGHRYTWRRLVVLLVVALLALVGLAAIQGRPPGQTVHAQGQNRTVLAFYYAWYDPSSFGPGRTPYQPVQPYYSSDASVIQRQVSQAKAAGIDGFVQSWYGPSGNQTESNFRTLLDVAAATGFKAAVDFETNSPFYAGNDDRAAALSTLLSDHAGHPAYLRIGGKPVVFFWANWLLGVDDWAAIRDQVDPDHNSIWIAEGANVEYLSVFDGLHLYNTAWSASPAGTAATWAERARGASSSYGGPKYWVATAMPGFDDSLLGRGDNSVVRDRAGGAYYQASFAGAAVTSPDLLIINSFNEWAEGSQIEPSQELGSFYLDLTSQLSNAYKSGSVAPPLPQAAPTIEPAPAAESAPEPDPTAAPGPQANRVAAAQPLPSPTPLASPTAGPDGRIVYVVQAGDTLIGIASRFQVSLDELYALNELEPTSLLTIGQELVIGLSAEATAEALNVQEEFPGAVIREGGRVVYKVKEGDTLIGIAVRYNLTLEELLALNENLEETTVLRLGQSIIVGRVPVPEEVGGSADVPTPAVNASPTVNPTPRPTTTTANPTQATNLSVESVATASAETVATATVLPEPQPEPSAPPAGLIAIFAGVVGLLALIGALFLYLGRGR
ncbi:MAG: endo-1,3-alpha-glucanase family glycosylhydrolase [Candidatus Promineifilaceae bacterium]